jgi:hypothetical protein
MTGRRPHFLILLCYLIAVLAIAAWQTVALGWGERRQLAWDRLRRARKRRGMRHRQDGTALGGSPA